MSPRPASRATHNGNMCCGSTSPATRRNRAAPSNLKAICGAHLKDRYDLTVAAGTRPGRPDCSGSDVGSAFATPGAPNDGRLVANLKSILVHQLISTGQSISAADTENAGGG
jgi:hypothetical protein